MISIDDILALGTLKSSKNLRLSKYFQLETGGTSATPVPVGLFFLFFFLCLENIALNDLIFALISDSNAHKMR